MYYKNAPKITHNIGNIHVIYTKTGKNTLVIGSFVLNVLNKTIINAIEINKNNVIKIS